jgi:hypothetical protein
MSDQRFDEDLSRVIREKADRRAPISLRMRISAIPAATPPGRIWSWWPRLAAATLIVAAVAIVAASSWLHSTAGEPAAAATSPTTTSSSPTPAASSTTSGSPTPTGDFLQIRTELPLPSDAIPGCLLARLGEVRLTRSGTDLVLVNINSGEQTTIVWPYGFFARLVDGKAELVAPDGSVVAREGDVLDVGGGGGPPFHVCEINGTIYVNGQTW